MELPVILAECHRAMQEKPKMMNADFRIFWPKCEEMFPPLKFWKCHLEEHTKLHIW
jgi:hypothetical protein